VGEVEVKISLQKPHINQQKILDTRKRFNYLRCGRRFGKTSLISFLTAENIEGITGVFAPTYKDLHEIWQEVKFRFANVIASKNEQQKQIIFVSGGKIDFWSLEDPNSGRGRKYHRVIVDEAEKVAKLEEAWKNTIRFTLMDFAGDSYMLTTPKGVKTYFDTLFKEAVKDEFSETFQYSTADNPHIPRGEIEAILKSHDNLSLQQEFYGNAVDWNANNRFYYGFNKRHVSTEPIKFNPTAPIWLFHDFNVNPLCALVIQADPYGKWLKVIKEYAIDNSSTYDICERIRKDYPTSVKFVHGDATGWNRSTQSKGLKSNYEIIQQELRLNYSQIKILKGAVNPPHEITRSVGNMAFEKLDILIDASCVVLINDLETAQADQRGKLVKEGNTENGKHAIDCLRYAMYYLFGKK
jgi:Terminase large subunit, T4likevirus-type, N-terminal